MIGKNSLIVLILVALACIGFAILWHRCRPEPTKPHLDYTDSIQSLRYEAERKHTEAESIRMQIESHRIELKRLDSLYHDLVGNDDGLVRDSIRAAYLRKVRERIDQIKPVP